MSARIAVREGRCIGAGNCVELADDYFDQNEDDGTVIVLQDEVADADRSRVTKAVGVCPISALLLQDAA